MNDFCCTSTDEIAPRVVINYTRVRYFPFLSVCNVQKNILFLFAIFSNP